MSRQSYIQAMTYADEPSGSLKIANDAEITVYLAGTKTLAVLYEARTGGALLTNPLILDSDALLYFWADTGDYDIQVHDTVGPARFGDFTFGWQSSPTNPSIAEGDLSNSGDMEWTQELSGAWVPQLKASSVGSLELALAAATDAKLASPNNSVYHTILQASGFLSTEAEAGSYISGTSGESRRMVLSGSNMIVANVSVPFPIFAFANADYAVASKTEKLRLRAQILVNSTKPLLKFTVGLYPVTIAGGAAELKPTLGGLVGSSSVEFNEPAANAPSGSVNADFAIPGDGMYAFGVVTSAKLTASSAVQISAQLQRRNV